MSGKGEVDERAFAAKYWPYPLTRAIPLLIVSAVIIFTGNHSVGAGLVALTVVAVTTGAIQIASAILVPLDQTTRLVQLCAGVFGVLIGALSIVFGSLDPAFLLAVSGVWGVVAGGTEAFIGIRARGITPAARDWTIVGVTTLLFGLASFLIPPGLHQAYGGIQKAQGALTSSILSVGLMSALTAISGVFLLIGAFSLKWGPSRPEAVASNVTKEVPQ